MLNNLALILKTCLYCGKEFTAKHGNIKTCSDECKREFAKQRPSRLAEKRHYQSSLCLYCGIEFTPKYPHQKCCCQKHGYLYGLQNRNEKYSYICKNCGKEYKTAYKDRNNYCSRECSDAHVEERKCEYCGKYFSASIQLKQRYCSKLCRIRAYKGIPIPIKVTCFICGKLFFPKANNRKICETKKCHSEYTRICSREINKKKHQLEIQICKECGIEFIPEYGNKHRDYCSYTCSDKRNRRIGKAIRRARKNNNGIVEHIDPIEIFKRDKWHCQLCGIKTPEYLRGSIEDTAPELDHVIPLALGGSHASSNVQCLCRKCNQRKGVMIVGKPRFDLGMALNNFSTWDASSALGQQREKISHSGESS